MAYDKTTWNKGDVITADKMNKLEQGVADASEGSVSGGTTIDTVSVTVDENTGTPSATGSVSGSTLSLDFKNLKGATGAAAGFGTPTASASSLDAEAVPTVEVSATGDDTAKVLTFTFGIPKGEPGANGATPTFTIGTVTTGEAGTNASVEITGTAPNYVLNLTIPQGAAGASGSTPTLTIGTVTTGAAGSSASATLTGTAPDYVLNLTIPQGTAGNDGSNAVFQILTAAPSASDLNDGEVAFVVES